MIDYFNDGIGSSSVSDYEYLDGSSCGKGSGDGDGSGYGDGYSDGSSGYKCSSGDSDGPGSGNFFSCVDGYGMDISLAAVEVVDARTNAIDLARAIARSIAISRGKAIAIDVIARARSSISS